MNGLQKTRWLLLGIFMLAACSRVAETYRLENNQTLTAQQHLIALEVILEEDSVVTGDLNVTASRVKVNGEIQGDLTVAASRLELQAHAQIQGDLIYCLMRDGVFEQAETAIIRGEIRNNCTRTARPLDLTPSTPWVVKLVSNLAISLALGLVAALGSIFLPHHLNRIQLTAYRSPSLSLGMGFFTVLVLIGLSNLWGLSLRLLLPALLMPLISIIWIGVWVLMLFGCLAIATPLGAWILNGMQIQKAAPIIAAIIGASSLSFMVLSFRLIHLPLISLLLGGGILLWGLGAVLITRAGTRTYRP